MLSSAWPREDHTAHPTAEWATQQIVEAFPADGTEPRYLLRDRDSIHGGYFRRRAKHMGTKEVGGLHHRYTRAACAQTRYG